MKHKIMGSWIAVWMLVLLFPDLAGIAHAGGINSAEQKVISAASGTFSYQGKTYAVKSQYIAAGRSKLAEDGIDLSDAEADSYIAQFRNSYVELIEGGYCEEVGGQSEDSNPKDSSDQKKDADKKDADVKNKGDTGKNTESPNSVTEQPDRQNGDGAHSPAEKAGNRLFIQTVLGEPQDNEEKDTADATQNPNDNTADADWLEEEDLGTTIEFEETDRKAAKEQRVTISEQENCYRIQKQNRKENQDNVLDQILHLKSWKVILGVFLGFALCTVAAIVWYIWTIRRRHRKKRRLRLGLAIAAGISIAGCSLLVLLVMGLYFGVYNKEAIHRQLMESDYYSGITQMTRKLASEKLQEAGCDQGIASEVFSLSHVYIEEKQYINGILSGKKNNEVLTEAVEKALQEKIPDTLGDRKPILVSEITELYQNTLQFELGQMIRESRQAFLPWCYGAVASSVFLFLVLLILTYQMYGYLHKSVRVCAVGIFVPSLLVAGSSLVLRIRHFAGKFHVEPVYYQQFIQKYVNWSVNVMLYVGCIGLLAAVALMVWKRYLHMIYVE